MSYGLYDADLPYYPTPFYNLELMKLSSYYKRKREIVGLSPNFSPNRYTNFIVRQDFYNPDIIMRDGTNITYGGRAIDGEDYKPLPLEIESMRPDILLYSKLIPNQVKRYDMPTLSIMRRAEHIRLSLDGKTIWNDFEKQFRKDSNCFGVIFHDYDLNQIDGAYDLIKSELPNWIKRAQGRRVGMKFPIQVYNSEDLCKWVSLSPLNTYFSLTYNGLINNSDIPEISKMREKSTAIRQISMDVSKVYTPEELINGGIRRIFRTIINLRSHRLFFQLIYNEALLINNGWKQVMKLINQYNKHLFSQFLKNNRFNRIERFETLYSYCSTALKNPIIKNPIFKKESLQSIFQFVRENDYELFKDFYEYRGGEVKDDR